MMNKEGNLYTFLYTTIMVIVVAGILTSVSLGLKNKQNKNIEIEKKKNILEAVNIASTQRNAEELFKKYITGNYVINAEGEKIDGKEAFALNMAKEMKKTLSKRSLPVYVFKDGDSEKLIVPVYGKGMWGPIWGFISFNDDKKTIYGVTFDHKSETPGLGAEISEESFQEEFAGKQIFDENGKFTSIKVVKGGAGEDDLYGVDAVSGGTVTSGKLEKTLAECLGAYETYFKK